MKDFPSRFCRLTLPFSPFIREGERQPHQSLRIRPKDALDLPGLVRELAWSTVTKFEVARRPWSLVSVYSPYTPNAHVMLMESSADRYLPGPEWVPDEEGDALMPRIARILNNLQAMPENESLHAGYNWAPRSWGQQEERTGFQSIPTKWHPMLWGWPALDGGAGKHEGYIDWVEASELTREERRLFGGNEYSRPLCELIRSALEPIFEGAENWRELFDFENAAPDRHTLDIPFQSSLPELFGMPRFFSEILKPIAIRVEALLRDLTETLTDMDCGERDGLLQRCETKGSTIWNELRKPPALRDELEISRRASAKGIPGDLIKLLMPPVRNRCQEIGDPFHWWRIGFGYALCLSSEVKNSHGVLKIMPGVYVGPGGIVETQSVILRRPEFVPNDADVMKKSARLWDLAKKLGSDPPK